MATLWVTNDADSGPGSLRWAISEANNASGPDTIEFASELADKTITLTSGELHITDDLTINGLGADKLTISGNSSNRMFLVDDGDSNTTIAVSISGLSLENGWSPNHGGAIFNREDLTVKDCALVANSAGNNGGGIYNSSGTLTVTNSTLANNSAEWVGGGISGSAASTLTVTNSTLADNSAKSNGGGISIQLWGTLMVTNSTLANNSADRGGGIFSYLSTLTVTNSTLANNSAKSDGGGIRSFDSTLTVTNSTLAHNSAFYGGGIFNRVYDGNPYDSLTVANSVLAGNTASRGPEIFSYDNWTYTAAYNIIQDGADSWIFDGQYGNQVGVDPLLDPNGLQDNGGPTQTIALMSGSPAINAGNNELAVDAYGNPLEFDQRGPGFNRIVGTVDIGAFENQLPVAAILASIQLLFQEETLNRGQANSLSVKLLHVQQQLDAGQTHVALNLLGAFSNQVQDFLDDGLLTAEQGQSLLDAADALWTSLTVVADA